MNFNITELNEAAIIRKTKQKLNGNKIQKSNCNWFAPSWISCSRELRYQGLPELEGHGLKMRNLRQHTAIASLRETASLSPEIITISDPRAFRTKWRIMLRHTINLRELVFNTHTHTHNVEMLIICHLPVFSLIFTHHPAFSKDNTNNNNLFIYPHRP